eukprot:TRINITY_DN51263_c0_g1_i1.p1 TRINITY_DN51263_c0_g1~~TRINITY_DN51263_c0_g1_i1.p1  ORF type:complete len:565 (+),score=116.58 TRINITY_DN51263_c0_g1_i1:147-1697(+)
MAPFSCRSPAELGVVFPAALAASAALCYWLPAQQHPRGHPWGSTEVPAPLRELQPLREQPGGAAAPVELNGTQFELRYVRTLGAAELPDGQLAEAPPPASCTAPGLCSLRSLAGGQGGAPPRWEPTEDTRWAWPYNISAEADGPMPLGQRAPNGDSERGPKRCIERPRLPWRYSAGGNCTVAPFTAERFCALMGPRSLLIVGDSLQYEQYMSLHFMLGGELRTLCAAASGHCHHSRLYCNGRVNITYIRNDWLSAVPLFCYNVLGVRSDHIGYPWMEAATLFDIVVVLVAAHITPFWTGNATPEHWRERIDHIVSYFASPAFRGLVVGRSQAGGHYGCPNGAVPPTERYVALWRVMRKEPHYSRMKSSMNKWRWDLYEHFNSYFRERLSRALPASRRLWLDTATPSQLRPDLHKGSPNDCLHYCLPGPPDSYNHMLLQALELHRCQLPEAWRRRPVAAPLEVVNEVVKRQVETEPPRTGHHSITSVWPIWRVNTTAGLPAFSSARPGKQRARARRR